jgi:hypothetical protein
MDLYAGPVSFLNRSTAALLNASNGFEEASIREDVAAILMNATKVYQTAIGINIAAGVIRDAAAAIVTHPVDGRRQVPFAVKQAAACIKLANLSLLNDGTEGAVGIIKNMIAHMKNVVNVFRNNNDIDIEGSIAIDNAAKAIGDVTVLVEGVPGTDSLNSYRLPGATVALRDAAVAFHSAANAFEVAVGGIQGYIAGQNAASNIQIAADYLEDAVGMFHDATSGTGAVTELRNASGNIRAASIAVENAHGSTASSTIRDAFVVMCHHGRTFRYFISSKRIAGCITDAGRIMFQTGVELEEDASLRRPQMKRVRTRQTQRGKTSL